MTTLIRLWKLVRGLNIPSKLTVIRRNTFKNVSFQRLLHSQTLFLTNQKKEFTNTTEGKVDTDIDEDSKMIHLFQHELQKYGRLLRLDVDKLLEDIKETGDVSNLQGLFLLQCCSELMLSKSALSRRVLADEIWNTLKKLDVHLDVSHYNALLNVYAETDHQYSSSKFLEDMVNSGIKPNRVTYQNLIAHYCNEGQVSEASLILNHAKSEGISINETMLSSLIYGHFINNNDDAAYEILKDMENLDKLLTIKTYSTLLYVYANRGEIDNIRKTLNECEFKGIWVPDKVLLKIIYNLSLHGFSQHVDEILTLTCRSNIYLKEATKIIYKLIEKHHYEVAFKIYQTVPENRTIIGGNAFLQALINSNAPLDKSIEYCKIMEKEKLNPQAFLTAVKKSIANDMYESSISLLKAWNQLGGVIKDTYFFPILKAYGEAGQYEELTNVLKKMILEFNIQPSLYTLTNGIIPYIRCDYDEILPALLSCHVNAVRAGNANLIYLLKQNEIRKSVKLINSLTMDFRIDIVKLNLLKALKNTEDVPSFVSIFHHLYILKFPHNKNLENNIRTKDSREFADSFISETVDFILSKNEPCTTSTATNKYLIYSLFRNLIDKGISLSPSVGDDIKTKLSKEITPEIEKALISLTSEDLVLKPIKHELQMISFTKKLKNIEKLESLSKLLSVTNKKDALIYKKKLLHYYCNILDVTKIYDILQEIESKKIEIIPSMYATVIDAFLRMNKIDEAEMWLLKATARIPDFHISKVILLKLVTNIAEQGHFQRALERLKQPTFQSNTRLLVTCTKFLSAVMKFDDENYLLQAFDVLNENGYIIKLENHLFLPIILFYVLRGDNKAALERFQRIYEVYGFAPGQIQLMKAFIETKDEISLNQVITISEKVNGSLTCYFNLALAHIENSELVKAKEIIEKHSLELPETMVFERAAFYCNTGQINNLENLFEILNDLNYDVEKLCIVLLKSFGHYNQWEKGYKLWTRMQEENIKPSNMFFDYLNLIVSETGSANSILQEFFKAVNGSDEIKTRELLEKLPLLYKSDGYSRLCKKCCKKENFSDVIELCTDLRDRFNLDIRSFDAELILNTMVQHKDVTSVEKMGMCMSQRLKNQIKYHFYLSRVYLISGSWNLYLKDIRKKLEKGTLNWLNLNMHVKIAVASLFQHPELLEQFESLAYACNEQNIPRLIHVLWIYYFFNDDLKAKTIWLNYIKNSKISTWLEVKNLQQTEPEMYIKIAELLQDSALNESIKLSISISLIDRVLKSNHPDKYEIGVKCLMLGTKSLPMESYGIDLLVDLQRGLEDSGTEWPWSKRFNKVDKRKVRNAMQTIIELSG